MNEFAHLAPITAGNDIFAPLVAGFILRLLFAVPIPIVDEVLAALSPFPKRQTREPLLRPTDPVPAPDWVRRDKGSEETEGPGRSEQIWRALIGILFSLAIAAYLTHLGEAASPGGGGPMMIFLGALSFLFGIGRGVLIWLDYLF